MNVKFQKRGEFTFRLQANEVPKIIVCRLALRDLIMRFGFDGMNKVRKLDRFLNEEDGNIIPDQIPISLLRVKFGGKAANVSDSILRQKTLGQHRASLTVENIQRYHESPAPC